MWKHGISYALEKLIMAGVSGYINIINVFHDVNLILYTVR